MKRLFEISLVIFQMCVCNTIMANEMPISSNEESTQINSFDALSADILKGIQNVKEIPGLSADDLQRYRTQMEKLWKLVGKEGVVVVQGEDRYTRPLLVGLQGIAEDRMSKGIGSLIKTFTGAIHTPAPPTPLCTPYKAKLLDDLIDESISEDPKRLFTVTSRAQIVREALAKGAIYYSIYQTNGMELRTPAQQEVYKQELENYAGQLFDVKLSNCDEMPAHLVGADYFFEDTTGKVYVCSIRMTQAKSPFSIERFIFGFAPLEHPEVQKHLLEVSAFLKQHGCDVYDALMTRGVITSE